MDNVSLVYIEVIHASQFQHGPFFSFLIDYYKWKRMNLKIFIHLIKKINQYYCATKLFPS